MFDRLDPAVYQGERGQVTPPEVSSPCPPERRCTLPDTAPGHDRPRPPSAGSDPWAELPAGSFPGTIHLVDTEAKALRAAFLLRRERTLGLDTESRPSFRKGEFHPISLVQLATHRHAFLYRVRPGAPFRSLKRILENPAVRKIVQGAAEETRELRRDLGIEARGFVDLPAVARAAGFTELNLRALAAAALGIRISKAAQRSDWSRPDLTRGQLEYAATDAWACLAVHEKIESQAAAPAGRPVAGALAIRPPAPSDAEALAGLVRELAAGEGERTQIGAGTVRAWLGQAGSAALIAERGGRAVGLLAYSLRLDLFHARPCSTIDALVVTASARGTGIGRALLEAAVREAERRGCAEISVSTTADNARALALYRSAGLTDEAILLEKHLRARRPRRRARGRAAGA